MGTQEQVGPGYRSGQLEALYIEPSYKKLWNCKCDCGGSIKVIESKLRLKQRRTCHLSTGPHDPKKKEFDYLKALRFVRMENKLSVWAFKCTCGEEFEKPYVYVKRGWTKSCGCKTKELKGRFRRLDPERSVKNNAYCHHLAGAEKRKLVSFLTQAQYFDLIKKPCHYCGEISLRTHRLGELKIPCNSVDRLNNEPYYKLENSVPCCFDCQTSKMDMPVDQYREHIKRSYNHMFPPETVNLFDVLRATQAQNVC